MFSGILCFSFFVADFDFLMTFTLTVRESNEKMREIIIQSAVAG